MSMFGAAPYRADFEPICVATGGGWYALGAVVDLGPVVEGCNVK